MLIGVLVKGPMSLLYEEDSLKLVMHKSLKNGTVTFFAARF